MNIEAFFNDPLVPEIIQLYKKVQEEKLNASYNLFTISSYNSYLENFHSDILASLLNPDGLHGQGYTFLHLFIRFLQNNHKVDIAAEKFSNTIVSRETGRLDIWIRDEQSNQSIIIENKINNAPDMDRQLDRYFTYANEKHKYNVNAIVYLSLDGKKVAPQAKEQAMAVLCNIAAFNRTPGDLVNGWLQPCLDNASNNMDSYSVIHQYIKLLNHLSARNMDTQSMKAFYRFINQNNRLETFAAVEEMYKHIGEHRADMLTNAIINYAPFTKRTRYKEDYILYENYQEGLNTFKLDVWFRNNGEAGVVFWNSAIQNEQGREPVVKKLTDIDMFYRFDEGISFGYNGCKKEFNIGTQYPTMQDVDNAVLAFVQELMAKLKQSAATT